MHLRAEIDSFKLPLLSRMQFTAEIAAIRSFHNFQRVMDFFQPIFLPCSYLLEDSKWILFTVITVLTAAHLQCIRLMLTRYPADAGNVYSLFKLFTHPLWCCLDSIFWTQRGRSKAKLHGWFFCLSHSSLMPWAFFSMDIHCFWVSLPIYLHGIITKVVLCLKTDLRAYLLKFFHVISVIKFHINIWLLMIWVTSTKVLIIFKTQFSYVFL